MPSAFTSTSFPLTVRETPGSVIPSTVTCGEVTFSHAVGEFIVNLGGIESAIRSIFFDNLCPASSSNTKLTVLLPSERRICVEKLPSSFILTVCPLTLSTGFASEVIFPVNVNSSLLTTSPSFMFNVRVGSTVSTLNFLVLTFS